MVTLSGGNALEKKLAEIVKKATKVSGVEVGFMEDATYPTGESVATVAALNEFGHGNSLKGKLSRTGIGKLFGMEAQTAVPPRPFFRGMIKEKSPEWPAAISALLIANDYDAEKTLTQTGEAIKGQLQEAIIKYVGPPLAQSTIDRKGHDKQLIETGIMKNSVSYNVK